ncbi:DNA-3-methyladenine glycosylase [soil metagenome]
MASRSTDSAAGGGALRQLDRSELLGDPFAVARRLLNRLLVVAGRVARIVEVEAYWGEHDPASHAFRGETPRNRVMFGAGGLLYVYRSYGLHWCANVVVGEPGSAAAVLLRAVEPVEGVELMQALRPLARRPLDLTNGPGKLCAALDINGEDGGTDLCAPDSKIRLCADDTDPPTTPGVSTRVGISQAMDLPWRFYVDGNPWVSKGRPARVDP